MGQPAGRHGPARDLWVPGVRREVKHLSTCRKGYSVSSGERKRIRPNHGRVIPVGGCVRGVAGACVPVPTDRAGASPVPGSLPSSDHVSQVARASWNPV